MGINYRCPKCGSTHVQVSNEKSKHGCFWAICFGLLYFMWLICKWTVGFLFLIYYDWWMAIICKANGKGYIWHSAKWFSTKKRICYCHNCGHNFKA